ncbi:MAG: hypothetical protein GY698_06750 [Actinomycetia bacterium]|nr:hypothetical protein [Actinomycetes bacterium]
MPTRRARLVSAVVAVAVLVAACGSDTPKSELLSEAIEERTGRPVAEAELAARITQAERLCVLGDDLLGAVVTGRSAIELNIYDAYFDVWCPDRAPAYLAARPGDTLGVGETPPTTSPATTASTTTTTEREP